MKVAILLLCFTLLSIQYNEVESQDLQDSINQFRDAFRQGLQALRGLCPRNRGDNNNNDNDNNQDDNDDDNNDDNDNNDNNNDNNTPISNFQNFCNCRLGASSRIVNGQIAKKNSIPWHVSLATRRSGSHFCGT